MVDIVVIGGGVIGMLTARELCLAGYQVSIIEKGMTGQESSWAGGGIVSPLFPWRYSDAVNELARWGQAYYPELIAEIEEETGLEVELVKSGMLFLDDRESEKAKIWAKKWQANLQVLDKEEVFEIDSNLSSSTLVQDQAIWMPEIRQVRNPRFVAALKQFLVKQGVNIVENEEVKDFMVDGNKVSGVITSSGKLHASKVLLAGGAWSANLLKKIGFSLNVEPVKGQMLLFKAEPGVVNSIILSRDRYVIPRQDGRVLIGSTLEYTDFDKSTSLEARDALFKEAIDIIPALEQFEIEHHWAGLRPGSVDGVPYICAHPELEGLYINTGHFRNGIVLGPASARLMADIILQRTTILNPNLYM